MRCSSRDYWGLGSVRLEVERRAFGEAGLAGSVRFGEESKRVVRDG